MKTMLPPQPPGQRWLPRPWLLLVSALVISDRVAMAANPGELDSTFAPQLAELPVGPGVPWLTVVGSDVFLHSFAIDRYGEDGRRDPDWATAVSVPVGSLLRVFEPLPWGGWLVGGPFGSSVDLGDGTSKKLPSGFNLFVRFRPLDSGGFLATSDGSSVGLVGRFDSAGARDPAYAANSALMATLFNDNAGTSQVGGPFIVTALDSQGRLVVGGNLIRAGNLERRGILRLLADGSVDPWWDPAPAIGIAWNETDGLNARPVQLTPGVDDAVLLGLQLQAVEGKPQYRLVTVRANGEIAMSVSAGSSRLDVPPLVQPDGRIVVGGGFTNWAGRAVTGLVRLLPDGSDDPSFTVVLGSESGIPTVHQMSFDDQGRLVLVGQFDSVNGVARPGLARVYAFAPSVEAPQAGITCGPPRVGTNEVLYLTAAVTGFPPPAMQWYRNGEALAGATHRGLRIVVTNSDDVGQFSVTANNAVGSTQLSLPEVRLAERSRQPGALDSGFGFALTNLARITQLIPQSESRLLVCGGTDGAIPSTEQAMLVRLNPGGTVDSSFGLGGVVMGDGMVETVRELDGGNLLVAGRFTRLAGVAAWGLAELDADGRLVPRAFPMLAPPYVSAALPLPAGGWVVAGQFSQVGLIAAHRLVRLTPHLEVDPAFRSPLLPWQFVDTLALDSRGRLLIGGARVYTEVVLTNPAPVGLQRLLPDGSADPAFAATTAGVRSIWVDPDRTLVVGPNARRLTEDGALIQEFDLGTNFRLVSRPFSPDHTAVWSRTAGMVMPGSKSGPIGALLGRWTPSGQRDSQFLSDFPSAEVEAAALLPDGGIVVARRIWIAPPAAGARWIERIAADSDSRFVAVELAAGQLRAELATQPGRRYEIRKRTDWSAPESDVAVEIEGDGYVQEVAVPADVPALFLELHRP